MHTNHFVDPRLATGDVRVGPEPDTLARHRLLSDRAARQLTAPVDPVDPVAPVEVVGTTDVAGLMRALCAHEEDEGAPVCCHAPPSAPLGEGWQTLATVVVDPAGRRMAVTAGGPCGGGRATWSQVTPG